MGLLMRMHGDRERGGGVADLMDALRALYEPAQRHTVEQRQHDRLLRDTEQDGAPPLGPVDLDSGRVRIRRRRTPD